MGMRLKDCFAVMLSKTHQEIVEIFRLEFSGRQDACATEMRT